MVLMFPYATGRNKYTRRNQFIDNKSRGGKYIGECIQQQQQKKNNRQTEDSKGE